MHIFNTIFNHSSCKNRKRGTLIVIKDGEVVKIFLIKILNLTKTLTNWLDLLVSKGFFFLFSDSPQIYKRKDVLDKFVVTQTKQNEKFRKKKKIFFQRVKYDNNLGTFKSNGWSDLMIRTDKKTMRIWRWWWSIVCYFRLCF